METVADEEGRYRFEGVAPGNYYLQIDVGGYAEMPYRREVNVEDVPEGAKITGMDIQLVRRASLHVWVTDTDGRPIADAEVRYVMPDQRTDENGVCRYEEVRPEWPCHLMVDHPEYAFAIADSVILAPGEDRRMTFVLSSGGVLEGTIRDGRGDPVPDARVLVCSVAPGCPWYWARRFGRIVHADANGHYRAERVPRGSIRLVVDHRDPVFAPVETIVRIGGDGSVTRRDLSVSSGGTVTGRVMDARGQPVAGVRVYFTPRRYPWRVLTDEEGRYRAEHVPVGAYEVATDWYPRDEHPEKQRVVVKDGETATVDLVVGEGRVHEM